MPDYERNNGIMFDIDGTLIDFKETCELPNEYRNPYSLFYVLERAGELLAGKSKRQVRKILNETKKINPWWEWEDFILALGLTPRYFWDFAYQVESDYLEPTQTDIPEVIEKLHAKGKALFITTNNPDSAIKHKLRLAGLNPDSLDDLFQGFFGATSFQHMKWEAEFWRKAIEKTNLPPANLAVVGDNPCDDCEMPIAVGIGKAYLCAFKALPKIEESTQISLIKSFQVLIQDT